MNLGIIGAGMIVKDFLSFAHELPEIKLEAIVARNLENLKRLSDEYGIKNIYTNIEECLANTAIDTIYVAVPNNLHYSVAKKSLEAGKNVICEKPFTLNYEEAEELFSLADSKNLPLIITPHDTFSVTHLINRVTNDQIIKRDIITVESIYIKVENLYIINLNNTVKDWYDLQLKVGHTRYPVVNEYGKLVGIITARDVFLKDKDALIKEVMERKVSTTTLDTPISSVANTMLLEGFELMPVIDAKNTLLGVVTRKLVINSLLTSNRFQEGHNNDTFDEIMRKGIVPRADGLQVKIIPQMLDQFGTFSSSALLSIIDESIHITSYNYNRSEVLMQNVSLYFLKSVPLDRTVTTKVNILDIGRKTAKFDVEVFDKTELVAKAMVTCQVFQRN